MTRARSPEGRRVAALLDEIEAHVRRAEALLDEAERGLAGLPRLRLVHSAPGAPSGVSSTVAPPSVQPGGVPGLPRRVSARRGRP